MRICAIVTCNKPAYGRWCRPHRKKVQRRMSWRQRARGARLVKLMGR